MRARKKARKVGELTGGVQLAGKPNWMVTGAKCLARVMADLDAKTVDPGHKSVGDT